MRALILDTETTGLDPKTDRVIELGYRVVEENMAGVTEGDCSLMWDQTYPPITEEIARITGIDQDLLFKQHVNPHLAFNRLSETIMMYEPEIVLCYNAEFDEGMVKSEIARGAFSLLPGINRLLQLPWVCAMKDHEPNYKYKCWKLSHIALDHGVVVDPSKLHRALADVDLTQAMLTKSGAKVSELLAYNKVPWVVVAADTEKPWLDGGRSTDLAKKRGYNWEVPRGDTSGKKFDKAWVKRIKEHQFEQEQREAPFQVSLIK